MRMIVCILILAGLSGLCAYDRMPNGKIVENALIQWRLRKGYTRAKAELALQYKPGTISRYENLGLTRIPVSEITRMLELYEVSQKEFQTALCQTKPRRA